MRCVNQCLKFQCCVSRLITWILNFLQLKLYLIKTNEQIYVQLRPLWDLAVFMQHTPVIWVSGQSGRSQVVSWGWTDQPTSHRYQQLFRTVVNTPKNYFWNFRLKVTASYYRTMPFLLFYLHVLYTPQPLTHYRGPSTSVTYWSKSHLCSSDASKTA
jgi:hypothetical protein